MAKPEQMRCPGVLDLIAEVEQLDNAGDCWCSCVKDDIPKAKELAARGLCLGAAKVAKAARARCTSKAERLSQGVPQLSGPVGFEPVRPMTLPDMLAFGQGKPT